MCWKKRCPFNREASTVQPLKGYDGPQELQSHRGVITVAKYLRSIRKPCCALRSISWCLWDNMWLIRLDKGGRLSGLLFDFTVTMRSSEHSSVKHHALLYYIIMGNSVHKVIQRTLKRQENTTRTELLCYSNEHILDVTWLIIFITDKFFFQFKPHVFCL